MEPGDENIQCLYKYRAINENTLRILNNHELFFSFPKDFNDPFDCRVDIIADGNDDDIKKWVEKSPYNEHDKQRIFHSLKTDRYKLDEIIENTINNKDDAITVLCLSQKYDNILMWSHYANSHKGICLGFKTNIYGNSVCIKSDDSDLIKMGPLYFNGNIPAIKIEYNNNMPPPYNLMKGDSDGLKPFILRKCEDWKYEEERRLILFHKYVNKQTISYPIEILSEVYFGCEICEKDMFEIVKTVTDKFINNSVDVKFYKMKLAKSEYKLERVDLNI